MKEIIFTEAGATPKGPYSQGVIAHGPLLYVAAQGPNDPKSGELVGETFTEQAEQVFRNIQTIVEAAGASMADVVKVNVYLSDWKYFDELNQVYARFFPEPYPVRSPIKMDMPGGFLLADAIACMPTARTD